MKKILLPTLLFLLPATLVAQGNLSGMLTLRGDDFPGATTVGLQCSGASCWSVSKEGAKQTTLRMNATVGEKNITFDIAFPGTLGGHKIKVDKDGDQRANEHFTMEVSGSNPAVDKVTYTVESAGDEASVQILKMDEKKHTVEGSFSARFTDPATGNHKAVISGRFVYNDNNK